MNDDTADDDMTGVLEQTWRHDITDHRCKSSVLHFPAAYDYLRFTGIRVGYLNWQKWTKINNNTGQRAGLLGMYSGIVLYFFYTPFSFNGNEAKMYPPSFNILGSLVNVRKLKQNTPIYTGI